MLLTPLRGIFKSGTVCSIKFKTTGLWQTEHLHTKEQDIRTP